MKAIDPQTPCGIWNYMPSSETREILSKYINSIVNIRGLKRVLFSTAA